MAFNLQDPNPFDPMAVSSCQDSDHDSRWSPADFPVEARKTAPIRIPDQIKERVVSYPTPVGAGSIHQRGCVLDLDHEGGCEVGCEIGPLVITSSDPQPTEWKTFRPAPTPGGISPSDFSPVAMNAGQREAYKLLEIRYRALAQEIIDLIPSSAHRERALRQLLESKMTAALAVSRNREVKL